MSGASDSFLALEKHRLQLQENVKQLRKALQHWQTWDAEYEALKEEVEAIPDPCTPDDLHKIHAEFDGELLIGREIDEVFGFQHSKSRSQIINVLQRRIDYVGKNVSSLEKQLETAENKYAAATVVSQPDAVDEDGQPITEIIEELDDNDNVVSYRLNQPGNALSQVHETLEKAGVHDLPFDSSTATKTGAATSVPAHDHEPSTAAPNSLKPSPSTTSRPPPARTTTIPSPTPSVKKSVSFSEDAQPAQPPSAKVSARAKRVDRIMKTAKEQENISKQDPVIPEDEDEDDAELRRQMLQYSMSQVGAVVAEIDLEEDVSGEDEDHDSGFEYGEDDVDEGDDDDDVDDDDDDEEDRFGRFTGRVVTDKYRRRMLELEQKLGVKSRFTEQTERDEAGQSKGDQGGIGRIVVQQATDSASSSKSAPSKSSLKESRSGAVEEKRGVRFAQALDIAPQAEAISDKMPANDQTAPIIDPLGDVVERTTPIETPGAKQARKPSRFKKAMDVNPVIDSGVIPKGPFDDPTDYVQQKPRSVPTGPKGSTIADKLVERDTPSSVIAPDEFDDTMVHQEVADEYHRMRRKFIQRDGGFLKEDESVIQPLDDAGDGEPVSRFKAARLSRH
ncbi:hypothetical protein E4U43_007118 [Claviceps pusilla]|uniref:DUF3835 domain-containing protein n=1 Tax=Claviceps pusilla TaxID=123648 RepID=A0A9P7NFE2_9HYPO|nr:hypothetical protein E4U43_007118 [Claviceps pusilla]